MLTGFTKPPTYPGVQMKKFLLIVCLFASSPAFATTAVWTGNKEQFKTAAGKMNWKCEYRVIHTTEMIFVWRVFSYSCPSEIDVETE